MEIMESVQNYIPKGAIWKTEKRCQIIVYVIKHGNNAYNQQGHTPHPPNKRERENN